MAPIERGGVGGGWGVGVLLVVEFAVELDVGEERVAVRSAMLAVRVKYIGRSWLSQVAGAVTVAPPRGLKWHQLLQYENVPLKEQFRSKAYECELLISQEGWKSRVELGRSKSKKPRRKGYSQSSNLGYYFRGNNIRYDVRLVRIP
jgi:hypothetical protein